MFVYIDLVKSKVKYDDLLALLLFQRQLNICNLLLWVFVIRSNTVRFVDLMVFIYKD